MIQARSRCLRLVVCVSLFFAAAAYASGIELTRESEVGFKRFMRMAEEGDLGAGVDNANVAISKLETRIELVHQNKPVKVFILAPKTGDHGYSRYFDITIGAGAVASDVAIVGAALDEAFESDPHRVSGVEAVPGWAPPTWGSAWRNHGWRGLVRAVEMRWMMPVSRAHALATTAMIVLFTVLSCAALWLAGPSD